MTIKITVDRDYCIIAIAHALYLKATITNKKSFISQINQYVDQYGRLCLDDHESELNEFIERSTEITDKYFY